MNIILKKIPIKDVTTNYIRGIINMKNKPKWRSAASLIEELKKLNPNTEVWGFDDGSIIFSNQKIDEYGSIACDVNDKYFSEGVHFNKSE